jgi:hypothetical protein
MFARLEAAISVLVIDRHDRLVRHRQPAGTAPATTHPASAMRSSTVTTPPPPPPPPQLHRVSAMRCNTATTPPPPQLHTPLEQPTEAAPKASYVRPRSTKGYTYTCHTFTKCALFQVLPPPHPLHHEQYSHVQLWLSVSSLQLHFDISHTLALRVHVRARSLHCSCSGD